MTEKTVTTRLRLEIAEYLANTRKAALATREFSKELGGLGTTGRRDIEAVGRGALLMAGGVTVALGLSAKAAIDWESAWAGVTKTVGGSTTEMAALEDGLRQMATTLPATHAEIAAVAEAAGALGIKREAILGFTQVMIDLGETTDLTADQAANSMARIANVMQTPQSQFDRMGSTLVALGNAGASTESEILELSQRLSAAGAIAGLSEADILGFGSALSSVGVEAEAGGSALSKVFTSITDAVADGGDKLTVFARTAGVSADQFATAFRDDPAEAIEMFIAGLGQMIDSGQSLTPVLEELEFTDIRLMNALKSTASAGDLLSESLDLANVAWEENNALQDEASKRYDTTQAKLEMLRNSAVDLGIDVGDNLLPPLLAVVDVAGDMVRGFGEMDGAAGTVVTGLGGISAAGLGVIGVVGTLGPKYKAFQESLKLMGPMGASVAGNLGKLTMAAGGVGIAIALAGIAMGQMAEKKQKAIQGAKDYAAAIREETGALNENIDTVTANKLGEWAGASGLREANADFTVLMDTIRTGGPALRDLAIEVDRTHNLLGTFDAGNMTDALEEAGLAGTAFGDELVRLEGTMSDVEFVNFVTKLSELGGEYEDGAVLAANLSETTDAVGDSAEGATPKLQEMAGGLSKTEEEAEAARTAFEDLMDSYRAAVDPLFAVLDATDGLHSAQRTLAEALIANADAIDDNNVSQAELDAMYRDVASSALDVEVATRDLAFAVQEGTVSVDTAKGMLAEWVAQGLITEEQARQVAGQFETAAEKASAFEGDYVASVSLTGAQQMFRELDALARALNNIPGHVRVSVGGGGGVTLAAGGRVTKAGVEVPGRPKGTDTIPAMLTEDEFVINARAANRFGYGNLEAINRGQAGALFHGGADSGGIVRSGGATIVQAPPVFVNIQGAWGDFLDAVVDGLDDRRSSNGLGSVTRT